MILINYAKKNNNKTSILIKSLNLFQQENVSQSNYCAKLKYLVIFKAIT